MKCKGNCFHWDNNIGMMPYSTEENGWRRCGVGNIIKAETEVCWQRKSPELMTKMETRHRRHRRRRRT